jgi:hypothetical protein
VRGRVREVKRNASLGYRINGEKVVCRVVFKTAADLFSYYPLHTASRLAILHFSLHLTPPLDATNVQWKKVLD